ncbi:MAG: AI-2E family transporter [Gammaproteobacteria bacterium]|nr:AI-2E family transporter [Gammaproteobacteria bacterium]MDE0246632.1 AI-2E family transporter [Gammaproteobacteria bacterium]
MISDTTRFQNRFLLVLALGISLLFLVMIRQFLVAILLATVFSGMIRPLYLRLAAGMRGRERAAAVATLLLVLVILVAPAIGFMGLVVSQAVDVSQAAATWVRGNMNLVESFEARLLEFPLVGDLLPDRERIITLAGQLAQSAGAVLVDSLTAATRGTTNFLFQLFVMLYAMYFFLTSGPSILDRVLYLVPLPSADEQRLLDRFVSVTRATIKGSLVIGVLQGGLAGLSFAVFGVPGAAFWATVMAVLSIVPALGTALVWVPAVIWLLATGQIAAGVSVGIWCGLVVGTVDNFLRPRLIGRDARLPDLMILLSTFGGILFFGAVGFILGPIVAALFVTVWEIFAEAYGDVLPEVRRRDEEAPETPPADPASEGGAVPVQ